MKKIGLFITCIFLINLSVPSFAQAKYKCMVQLTNYTGEGAYVVISLVNKAGVYEKTLYMMGPDQKWYKTLKEWHKAYKKKPVDISAVTGASVKGGERGIVTLDIDPKKINAGYTLRFETAVEDKANYATDVEVPLTTDGLAAKTDGKGYIRYVRFSAN